MSNQETVDKILSHYWTHREKTVDEATLLQFDGYEPLSDLSDQQVLAAFNFAQAFSNGTALCFVVGAFCSALAGFIGMRTATAANVRTAAAAQDSLGDAFRIAFS